MKKILKTAVLTSLGACAFTQALAQSTVDFPTRPIRIVVPFAAGGATDVIARVVGQKMSDQLGQPVVVDNKAGASGNIGAATVARATPDGYTILMATSSHAINATLYRKLDYSLTKYLLGLSNLASVPLLLVVNPGVPARSAAEFAAYAKAQGNTINFASGGTGTAAHLAGEKFNTLVGSRMLHVAYKGGAPAQTDLIGGQVQAMFANLPEVLAQVQAGKLKPLAVTGNTRRANLPEVPTFTEAGYAQMDARSWFGLFAPAGTPAPVVARLNELMRDALATPAVRQVIEKTGQEAAFMGPDDLAKFQLAELDRWGKIIKAAGIQPE